MRKMRYLCTVIFAAGAAVGFSFAGATVEIDENAKVDVAVRIQPEVIVTEKDLDGDGCFESDTDFKVRRGRLRLGMDVTEQVSAFLQSDVGSGVDGSGLDARIIDAYVTLKPYPFLHIVAGENMAPASRQNLTSSGALMAIDRPAINYKTLTWGTRAVSAFANNTVADTDAGLRGDVDVRDTGVTLFSSKSLTDSLHAKCYIGGYDGVQVPESDNPRWTGRVQINCFDPEGSYYNSSTYLGTKKTVGIGASIDSQDAVARRVDGQEVDYLFYTVDAFAELPAGPGSITVEAAYQDLDLDDATEVDMDGDPLTEPTNFTQSQGNGYYVQAGYLVNKWQPWVEYETWESDADTNIGGFDSYRAGISYFIKGHNANIKAGYERMKTDEPIGATDEDTIDSFVLGCFVTY